MSSKGKHRKTSRVRALLRRYAILPAAGIAAALVVIAATAGSVPANAATVGQDRGVAAANARMCAAFTRWADGGSDATAGRWARYLPGTSRYLYADGRVLVWALETGAPAVVKRTAFSYVYMDCTPDA